MCGVVGYVGKQKCTDILLNGMHKIQYRGVDSYGVAIKDTNNNIHITKKAGNLSVLQKAMQNNLVNGYMGIAHNRWATHGNINDINAHPHFNNCNTIALAHNGVIENHQQLRQQLQSKGYNFVTETDSEVAVHLLDSYVKINNNLMYSLYLTAQHLQGSYALLAIGINFNYIAAISHKRPLVLGLMDCGVMLASDILGMVDYTNNFVDIYNNEAVKICPNGYAIYNNNFTTINRKPQVKYLNKQFVF